MPQSSVSVRVSAVLAISGSVLMLLVASAFGSAAYIVEGPDPVPGAPGIPFKTLMLGLCAFGTLLSGWGTATGIGILRRQRWSRFSMLIFAGLLAVTSATGLIFVAVMPLRPGPGGGEAMIPIVRVGIGIIYGALAAIGIWWLAQFNGRNAKEYFRGDVPETRPARP